MTHNDGQVFMVGDLKIIYRNGNYNLCHTKRSGKLTLTAEQLTQLSDWLLIEMQRIKPTNYQK